MATKEQRLARDRMKRTGGRYTTALAAVRAEWAAAQAPDAAFRDQDEVRIAPVLRHVDRPTS